MFANEFASPEWEEPIDLEASIAACPADSMMRGMYTFPVCKHAGRITGKRYGRERYIAFKFYPMREHIAVVHECASSAYPDLPIRLALRKLGALAIPTLHSSLVGRTLLTLSGGTTKAALKIIEKVYMQARNDGIVRFVDFTPRSATFELRNIWDFADSVQVGIFEAALEESVGGGRVLIRKHSPSEVDIRLEWDKDVR